MQHSKLYCNTYLQKHQINTYKISLIIMFHIIFVHIVLLFSDYKKFKYDIN